VIAAINGHAVAGGCMLALACDRRVMVDGYPKISLNEITFASSVFAGSVEMLRFAAGGRAATSVVYSGWMYTARDAAQIGLIDEVAEEGKVLESARKLALDLGSRRPLAFSSIKRMLREPVAEEMLRREQASIDEMVEIWSTEPTRSNIKNINIY
jgi:enoyl-CoA hydratase